MRKNSAGVTILYLIGLVFFSNMGGHNYNNQQRMSDNTFSETSKMLFKFSDVIKAYLSLLPENELQLESHILSLDAIVIRQETHHTLTPLLAQRLVKSFLSQLTHHRSRETLFSLKNVLMEMEVVCSNTLRMLNLRPFFQKDNHSKRLLSDNFYTLLALSGAGLVGLIAYYTYAKDLLKESFNSEWLESKLEKEKQLSEALSHDLNKDALSLKVSTSLLERLSSCKDITTLDKTVAMLNKHKQEINGLEKEYNQNNKEYDQLLSRINAKNLNLNEQLSDFQKIKHGMEEIVIKSSEMSERFVGETTSTNPQRKPRNSIIRSEPTVQGMNRPTVKTFTSGRG